MKTIALGPFLGLNTRRPNFALHEDKVGDFLETAQNVDIDDAGRIHRRDAVQLWQSLANPHSLKMITATTGFLVRDSALYAITLPDYSETLLKVLSVDDRMSYAQIGDSWYFSNDTDAGRVTAGAAYPIGLPTPDTPAVSHIGGALLKGYYQVTVSHYNSVTGEEGGQAYSANLSIAGGGIRVTLPGPTTGADKVLVYLSGANGGVPRLAATLAAGTSSYDLIDKADGKEFSARAELPLPAGTLFEYNGRLCSFKGPTLCIGLAYRPGYYLPVGGTIPFPEDISIAAPVQGGVYVVADMTRFIPGDLDNVTDNIRDVMPGPAVPGTFFTHPRNTSVGWFSARGFVLADTEGNATEAMSENVDQTPPQTGVAQVCECDGYIRVFACGWSMNLKTKAVTSYTGWDFSSLSSCWGTKADGIYKTNAEDADATETVAAIIGFGKQNFGSEERKRMPAVYLGVDSPQPMQLRIRAPANADYTYAARAGSADLQMQRVDPGKGLLANWFELDVMNTNGAAFMLATVSFAPLVSSRRI